MKKTKEMTRIDQVTESILCNKCEKECFNTTIYKDIDGENFFVDGARFDAEYDYCMFDLCSSCINEFIQTFKIPPQFVTHGLTK